jgi:hypothetical protein
MVIFGAGASYDSLGDLPPQEAISDLGYRPPLANDLFERRAFFDPWIQQYHECGPVVERLRRLRRDSNFERELEKLRAEASDYPQRHVQLHAIRYYLRRTIARCGAAVITESKGVTNYATLLDHIAYWRAKHPSEEVRFVTFNYDTLLEHACETALKLPIPSIISYVSRIYRVYKPHGSVNWVRVVENGDRVDGRDPEHSIIGLGDSLKLRDDHYQVWHPEGAPVDDERRYVYPAIALPVETKSDFECPSDHLNYLKGDIPNVTTLLVIGWRATEAHFLDLWKQQPPFALLSKIAIVAGGSGEAQRVQNNLRAAGIGVPPQRGPAAPETRFVLSDQGFSDFVRSPKLIEFLAD